MKKFPVHRLRFFYILALSLIAILSISGQVMIQNLIKQQYHDSRIINIAGRQRTLSQKISKDALALINARNLEFLKIANEIQHATVLFITSHEGLSSGNPDVGILNQNSKYIEKYFQEITPSYENIKQAALEMNNLISENKEIPTKQLIPLVHQILTSESQFLAGMKKIVSQFEKETRARVEHLRKTELILLCLTLLILLLEAILIFNPMIKQVKKYISALEKSHSDTKKLMLDLKISNFSLETALEQARSATRMKTEFLANMSHEIKTPINLSSQMIELLNKSELSTQQKNFLASIRMNNQELERIIYNILDFSDMAAGKVNLNYSIFNLTTHVEECMSLLDPFAREKELVLTYEIEPTTPEYIISDDKHLSQIIIHLIRNGIKHTEKGQITLSVQAQAMMDMMRIPIELQNYHLKNTTSMQNEIQPYYELTFIVEDTGIGITDAQKNGIFSADSYSGSELNLSYLKNLVEVMGGKIWLENHNEKGAKFLFTIIANGQTNVFQSPQKKGEH